MLQNLRIEKQISRNGEFTRERKEFMLHQQTGEKSVSTQPKIHHVPAPGVSFMNSSKGTVVPNSSN